jgi:hypothetical protein
MQPIAEPFTATANSFWDTMNSQNGAAGFRIPDYQRSYDWSEDKIARLLEDCLNGFYYLSKTKQESHAFLGTIILVLENSEVTFDGTSLAVVDGQQRLTTLILICCALVEELAKRHDDAQYLREPTADWISHEVEYIRECLFSCVIGQLTGLGKTFPFPRLVRNVDNRARKSTDAEYRSTVAQFLYEFANYYQNEEPSFNPTFNNSIVDVPNFSRNYNYIRRQVCDGIYRDGGDPSADRPGDLDHEQIQHGDFKRRGLIRLFDKLDVSEDHRNRAISDIANTAASSGLVRLILFSYYLLKSVILTRVETRDEDAAFDIFDALNTTGEPLTALETLKPRIIRFEQDMDGYEGSETEKHFLRIEENLNNVYRDTDQRQKATKDLLVSFALYLEGWKLPLNLASQRTYLRTAFQRDADKELKRRVIQSLADIAEYRQTYWNPTSIPKLDAVHSHDVSDSLKLHCMFISDMNTSLAIPILARYWVDFKMSGDERAFAEAVRALTAFLVLRRSATGNTARIDSDFRSIMRGRSHGQVALCVGPQHSNKILTLDEFKTTLRNFLAARSIGVKNKESWLRRACEVGLATHSRPLCRFLLFAASHNSRPDEKRPGLLIRAGIKAGDELDFLNFRKWVDEKYATVEHVAPDSDVGNGWEKKIYERPSTRQTIGNLVLLPGKENSSVSNASWAKKKIFYGALIAKTHKERDKHFELAKREGLDFKKETKDLLIKRERLDMLDPIANVSSWTEKLIKARTKNTLELAWDAISPWLGY